MLSKRHGLARVASSHTVRWPGCLFEKLFQKRLPSPAPKPLRMKAMPLVVELGMLLVLLPPPSTRKGRELC